MVGGVTLASMLAMPVATFATETTPSTVATSTPTHIQAACDNRTVDYLAKVEKIRLDSDTRLAELRAERNADIDKHRSHQDAKWADRRAEMDAKIINLQARRDTISHSDNPAMKAAVEAYIAAVEAATKARWEAIKEVHAKFRTTQDEAIRVRRAAIDMAIKARREAVDTAIASWKTRCSGTQAEREAANKAFREALATARKNYHSAHETAFSTFHKTIKEARAMREASLKSIREVFHKALKEAKENFKAAKQAIRGTTTPTSTRP